MDKKEKQADIVAFLSERGACKKKIPDSLVYGIKLLFDWDKHRDYAMLEMLANVLIQAKKKKQEFPIFIQDKDLDILFEFCDQLEGFDRKLIGIIMHDRFSCAIDMIQDIILLCDNLSKID